MEPKDPNRPGGGRLRLIANRDLPQTAETQDPSSQPKTTVGDVPIGSRVLIEFNVDYDGIYSQDGPRLVTADECNGRIELSPSGINDDGTGSAENEFALLKQVPVHTVVEVSL